MDGPNASHITPQALDRWERRLEDLFAGRPYDMLDAALSDTITKFPIDIQVPASRCTIVHSTLYDSGRTEWWWIFPVSIRFSQTSQSQCKMTRPSQLTRKSTISQNCFVCRPFISL